MSAAPSSGGLVSALTPILSEYGGIWVGSTGHASNGEAHDAEVRKVLSSTTRGASVRYLPVFLSGEEQTNFYEGFSNEILWPLFHDLQSRCNFAPRYWEFYQRVNQRFAAVTLKASQPDDVIWIQDYQLMDVARQIRLKRPEGVLAFFMHIPFPAPDIFEKLPWRRTILEGLLEHDLLGVQTPRDERNMVACIRTFLPGAEVERAARLPHRHLSLAAITHSGISHQHRLRAVCRGRRQSGGRTPRLRDTPPAQWRPHRHRYRSAGLHQGHPGAAARLRPSPARLPGNPRPHLALSGRRAQPREHRQLPPPHA